MATFVVRVWVPDRPGALGSVASRIGAVRGDLVGIDILERGAGRAIDELVVDLPSEDLVPLLVNEISQVDGVDVEDVRPASEVRDHRLDALETAALLVEQQTTEALLGVLAAEAHHDFEADWTAVVSNEGDALAAVGDVPSTAWITAFVAGSQSSVHVAAGDFGPDDIACTSLPAGDLSLVLGRLGRPFRARERRQLGALARIAGRRCRELTNSPAARALEGA
jgi:hypothetical protein